MIQPKPKPCKGIGKASGVKGCGGKFLHRTFGLCNNCLSDFLFSTDAGKLIMEKRVIPRAKNKIQKEQKAVRITEIKKTREQRIEIMSPDKYRSKYLQPCINEIARLIDFGQPCIATGKFGKMAGGHFYSVGSNRTTAFNLHNIHIQTFESNGPSGGDPLLYIDGLKKIYSEKYFEFVNRLKQTPAIKLSTAEMVVIYSRAKAIRNDLRKEPRQLTPTERILKRNAVNALLGLYDNEFSIFENRSNN